MKAILFSAFLFSVSLFAAGTTQNVVPDTATTLSAYTHMIQVTSIMAGTFDCSATAIGPYALLTASHCEAPTNIVKIDDDQDAYIYKIVRDGKDHSLFLLSGVKPFSHFAQVTQVAPAQGESVSLIGNPGSTTNLYRVGHFSGATHDPEGDEILVFDYKTCHGDSGAGLFNSAGVVYAVESMAYNIGTEDLAMWMPGAFPLEFQATELASAASFVPPANAPKPPVKDKGQGLKDLISIFNATLPGDK